MYDKETTRILRFTPLAGDNSVNDIVQFANNNSMPLVTIFNDDTASKIFAGPVKASVTLLVTLLVMS